ncbi:uncharacterized protein BT62DRAFT_333857 [Guyanagaster necrorhizus]|uniref:Uncharacterized protein n=1 Tax=Guyanagaster necrorhizus TaxID=856835 RepID=A0A9P7VMS5_9AGAR|nr:uncharacterized protein BT62DRAFT_333857 [Guyanagaster necrorhizus MCA 3950]KAG7443492.1 hypothetical protein BT62DRAFT_333857 [Guyanagaster necrorhizus MCA 3950]
MARDADSRPLQELFDAIVDAVRFASPLSEAFKDLVSGFLVSRRSLPRARYFLFEAIYFATPERIPEYHDTGLKPPIISSSARMLVLNSQRFVTNGTFDDSILISILKIMTNIETIFFEMRRGKSYPRSYWACRHDIV